MLSARPKFSTDHDACGVGMLVQLGGPASHQLVQHALEALARLSHRGGVDSDGRSGDGAGLLTAIPDRFMRQSAQACGIHLPEQFAVGMAFIQFGAQPADTVLADAAAECGARYLGSRMVPVDESILGPRSAFSLPEIRQFFFAPARHPENFDLRLFRLRKQLERGATGTYFCSLSSRTIVYKGLLTPQQLPRFFPDLADSSFESSFAIFHQRYSTNTQPSWRLAQPFRFVAHNGEINTISSNRRWYRAREAGLRTALGLPEEAALLEEGLSDSGSFDNSFEIQLHHATTPEVAISRMIPPAWEHDESLAPALRRFYESSAQEPWDGPAAIVFSDGRVVGAKLDRNGLRPLRYTLTSDGLLVVASEVGILDLHRNHVIERQRLGPGELLLADPANGILFRPHEVGARISQGNHQVTSAMVSPTCTCTQSGADDNRLMAASGWTEDQFRILFKPLVDDGREAVWSMGDDAPPAFLSKLPRPLWDYCKQRFAQVTNPPIDPLRENHVMSLAVHLGGNAKLPSPLVDPGQLDALSASLVPTHRIDFTFEAAGGVKAARQRLDALAQEVACSKSSMIVLSDRELDYGRAPLPALLAASQVWESMVRTGRWKVPLVIETAQVIDSHHFALLIAAGASAVHPWLAMSLAERLSPGGSARYRSALEKGLQKVMARMGISTVASYRNSQLFETIGLDSELCARFFADAGQSAGAKSLDDLLQDYLDFHTRGFNSPAAEFRDLGMYRFRHSGEAHANSPELVRRMHRHIKSPSPVSYAAFAELAQPEENVVLRDLLEFCPGKELPVEQVESEASLLSRFGTQAMSLGAISPEAHRTLAIAMNRLGGRSNTGEGGEDPHIYSDFPEANNRVKQVASGRFGVTAEYLVHAGEIEIKMAQGSKPGEGGQLPAMKVSPYIARLRHAVPGTALISPPPHHDIYSIEDLAQLIYDLRAVNPHARIGVKLVSSSGVGIIATGVAKAGADVITISGHDGGTGASPLSSIKNTGLPWEIGLRDAHTALVLTGLRARVTLRVDGGLKFARDVVIAALLGAEEFGFGTAALLAIGCVMARQCHLNTCPVGIATQDEKLRARFTGNPEMVENYFRALAEDVRHLLATLGARSIAQIVGAVEHLRPRLNAEKAVGSLLEPALDAPIQHPPKVEETGALHAGLSQILQELESVNSRPHRFVISNSDRAVGAYWSGEMLRRYGGSVPDVNQVDCEFFGAAGQSFGAFLIAGSRFHLKGEANDYVGKGLCGGIVTVAAGAEASERRDVLVGNTVLYGATAGELYVAGQAGERFAVRNSGALAVVEGVGQHGCEYMTAGVVVNLGPAGINFGAGMTGGLAYLLFDHDLERADHNSVRVAVLEAREDRWLRRVLRRHVQMTGSPRAARLLSSAHLPLARVEPLQPPCSVEQTWASVLLRLSAVPGRFESELAPSEEPTVM